MAKYIDVEKFNNEILDIIFDVFKKHKTRFNIAQVQTLLQNTPTADVVEVKHGKWKQTKEPLGWQEVDCVECSSCGESWIIDEDLDFEEYTQVWKYCLNCGAKMDLKEVD